MQAGWDWAQETHDVTVTDERGHRVAHWTLRHREDELVSTMQRLAELEEPGDLPVAIETRSGLVVDRLLAAGHPVVPVHPNAFHALRPRWGAARAKSDAGDSYKLAEFLRTNLDADENTLRVLAPTLPRRCTFVSCAVAVAASSRRDSWLPINCGPCLITTGPLRRTCSTASTHRSRWPSSPAIPHLAALDA